MPDQDDTQKIHDTRHAEYLRNALEWTNYKAAMRGGIEYAKSCLTQHARELKPFFDARLLRACAPNLVPFVVNARSGYIAKQPPVPTGIESLSNLKGELLDNITGQGDSFTSLTKRIANLQAGFGTIYIVIDLPELSEEMRLKFEENRATRADEMYVGLRPYWTLMDPLSILNWGMDKSGGYEWLLYEQPASSEVLGDDNTLTPSPNAKYILWRKSGWQKLGEKGEVLSSSPNPFIDVDGNGVIPVVPIRFQIEEGETSGISILADIEPINQQIVNTLSLLLEICHTQTFGTLTMQEPDGSKIELGTSPVLGYQAGMNAPAFIQPSSENAAVLSNVIAMLVNEVLRLASLRKGAAMDSKQVASGDSKAWDFVDTEASLKSQYEQLADGLKKALYITGLFYKQYLTPMIEIPDDFGVLDVGDLITRFSELVRTGATLPPEMMRQLLRQLCSAIFTELPPDELEALLKNVDDYTTGDMADQRATNAELEEEALARVAALNAEETPAVPPVKENAAQSA